MRTYPVSLDPVKFNHKPSDYEAGGVSLRIGGGKVSQLMIGELIHHATLGGSFVPAELVEYKSGIGNRAADSFKAQQIFVLDIDNMIPVPLTEEEKRANERARKANKANKVKQPPPHKPKKRKLEAHEPEFRSIEYTFKVTNDLGLPIAGMYESFSSTYRNKFRVLFVLDRLITHANVKRFVAKMLVDLLSDDESIIDPTRIFYGSNNVDTAYVDEAAEINLFHLIDVWITHQYETDPTHAARNIKNICSKPEIGLDLVNGIPAILDPSRISSEILENVEYVTGDRYVAILAKPSQKGDMKSKNHKVARDIIEKPDFDNLYKCDMYADFVSGGDIHHDVTFAIMTNLLHIQGGKAVFFESLQRRDEYNLAKWEREWDRRSKDPYHPVTYKSDYIINYYPDLAEKMQKEHGVNSLYQLARKQERMKPMQTQTITGIELTEARALTRKYTEQAVASQDQDIHVIISDPGVGKSTIIRDVFLKTPACIAIPTHNLGEDGYYGWAEENNLKYAPPLEKELDSDWYKEYEYYQMMGAHTLAAKLARENASDIVERQAEALRSDKTVVVTHARLQFMDVRQDTIVIDEDILPTLFAQKSVSVKDLMLIKDLVHAEAFTGFVDINSKTKVSRQAKNYHTSRNASAIIGLIDKVINAPAGIVEPLGIISITDLSKVIRELAQEKRFTSNVVGLFNASHFQRVGDTIYYIMSRQLPTTKKIIIYSATIDEAIYKAAFRDRTVHFYRVPTVKYTIGQVCVNTSRNALKDDDKFKEILKSIPEDYYVITFKNLKEKFGTTHEVIATIGGLVGLNTAVGKNTVVVATPHVSPIVYALMASALGLRYTVGDMENISYRLIERNGWKYWFTTYGNDALRAIQFYYIENELIQAAHRSRPTSTDAVVIVFSDFMLPQAVLAEMGSFTTPNVEEPIVQTFHIPPAHLDMVSPLTI